jgi:3-oxoacyl-[acyl-carrier protein] reductase
VYCVVTGANGGIGRAIVENLAQRSLNIIVCCRSITPSLTSWADQLSNNLGVKIHPRILELDTVEMAQQGMKTILSEFQVSFLVNNAAESEGSLFMLTSEKSIKRIFEVNFFSTIAISQMVAKQLIRKRTGRIVNITSVSASYSSKGFLSYGASKAALNYSTKVMAEELFQYGVTVNAVAPGPTQTPMLDKMDEYSRKKFQNLSFSKKFSLPEEIASLVTFLLLDASEQITGKVLEIDGGMP